MEAWSHPRNEHYARSATTHVLVSAAALLAVAVLVGLSLTSAPADAAFPGLNGRIACSGNRGPELPVPPPTTGLSRQEVFSVNPDGSDEDVLTSNQRTDLDPVYSPDGTKIAFASARDTVAGEPSNPEIYVANNDGDLAGSDVQRLTYNRGQLSTGALNGVAATDASPSWSPDGTEIVFHSGREATFPFGTGNPNRFEIYKIRATPGAPGVERQLERLTENRVQDAAAEWSPDGTKIVYQSAQDQGTNFFNLEIFTMNPDGSGKVNVSDNPGTPALASAALDNFPTWSPDSKYIAFASSRDTLTAGITPTEVYRMNRDGTDQRRLTAHTLPDSPVNDRDFDSAPHWSPDGRRVLFNSGRETSETAPVADRFTIFTMDAETGEVGGLQRVADVAIFNNCSWQSIAPPPVPQPPTYPRPYPRPYVLPLVPFAGCPASSTNLVLGSAGNDNLNGTVRGDRIFAGPGNDAANALPGDDCVDLGPGVDLGLGGTGNDLLLGGLGADRIRGDAGNDRIRGNAGNDRLDGGTTGDRVVGDAGNDRVAGASGNDVLHGVSGNDTASGGSGRDRINGGSGRDRVAGGSSADRIAGDQGNDRVSGNSGNDRLGGSSGSDRINGGSGRDSISGGSGRDRISARDRTRDTINCGSGRDTVTADRIDRVSRNCERVRRR